MSGLSTNPGANRLVPCSLVLKGGVTSGIAYPGAIHEISKRHRFVHVAGTSAGAIGAAAAAAAEYGRQRGCVDSFAILNRLPESLASDRRLASLFSPAAPFRRVFRTLSLLGRPETFRSPRHAVIAVAQMVIDYPLPALLAGLIAAAYFAGLEYSSQMEGLSLAIASISSVVLSLVAFCTVTAATMFRELSRVEANCFGICLGYPDELPETGNERSFLTDWLHMTIQALAGLAPDSRPLTFGDLWGPDRAKPEIDLEMYTACLSEERPYVLPNLGAGWYFRRQDLVRLFPQAVVEWMLLSATRSGGDMAQGLLGDYLPLPAESDIPVVLAVRMSLSFPLLLSAIPLYRLDESAADDTKLGVVGKREPVISFLRYWFSDGGICSNFPVGLQKTGTDLVSMSIDFQYADAYAFQRNRSGVALAPDNPTERVSFWNFLAGVLGTMQNWKDRELQRGRSESRRAVVMIGPGEGGLNLGMSPAEISKLAFRGREAGALLSRESN